MADLRVGRAEPSGTTTMLTRRRLARDRLAVDALFDYGADEDVTVFVA